MHERGSCLGGRKGRTVTWEGGGIEGTVTVDQPRETHRWQCNQPRWENWGKSKWGSQKHGECGLGNADITELSETQERLPREEYVRSVGNSVVIIKSQSSL